MGADSQPAPDDPWDAVPVPQPLCLLSLCCPPPKSPLLQQAHAHLQLHTHTCTLVPAHLPALPGQMLPVQRRCRMEGTGAGRLDTER